MAARFSWSLGLAFVLSVSAAIAQPPPNYGDDPDAPIDMRFERAKDHHYRGEVEQAFAIYDEILAERPDDVPTIIT